MGALKQYQPDRFQSGEGLDYVRDPLTNELTPLIPGQQTDVQQHAAKGAADLANFTEEERLKAKNAGVSGAREFKNKVAARRAQKVGDTNFAEWQEISNAYSGIDRLLTEHGNVLKAGKFRDWGDWLTRGADLTPVGREIQAMMQTYQPVVVMSKLKELQGARPSDAELAAFERLAPQPGDTFETVLQKTRRIARAVSTGIDSAQVFAQGVSDDDVDVEEMIKRERNLAAGVDDLLQDNPILRRAAELPQTPLATLGADGNTSSDGGAAGVGNTSRCARATRVASSHAVATGRVGPGGGGPPDCTGTGISGTSSDTGTSTGSPADGRPSSDTRSGRHSSTNCTGAGCGGTPSDTGTSRSPTGHGGPTSYGWPGVRSPASYVGTGGGNPAIDTKAGRKPPGDGGPPIRVGPSRVSYSGSAGTGGGNTPSDAGTGGVTSINSRAAQATSGRMRSPNKAGLPKT